ncbi:MAG: ankyrin repeat domain-containing protein [Ornithinibacter sp.]
MSSRRFGHSGRLATASLIVLVLAGCTVGAQPSPTARPSASGRVALDAALRDAAWANDVPTARRLVAEGADVDAKDETQQSAYLIATSEGYLELLELTLASGADVDAKDSWNGTGLIRAAERGHHLVVGRLLRAGIDKDHVNRIGYQAVHEAVWFGADAPAEVSTVQVLVAGGVELGRPSVTEGLTPLQMARERGYRTLERVLTAADRHRPSADPDAALLAAAGAGDADAVALALRDGAQLEARDGSGRTALLLASAGDHLEAARVLVAMGADPDALDDQHDTPWLVTGVTGSVEMLEALLPASPDLGVVNRFGGVSVIPASERGHVEYVRRVVTTGIDVNHVNSLGWSALLEAVILGDGGARHQEIVRILLAAGADPSIGDRDGVTAREHADRLGFGEIAAILRSAG